MVRWMEGSRVALLCLLLLFIFLTPDQPNQNRLQRRLDKVNEQRQVELDILFNSSYGQFDPKTNGWLNLTGFHEHDGYRWEWLGTAQELSQKQFERAWTGIDLNNDLPIYDKVTGEIRGKVFRQDIPASAHSLNLTALEPKKDYMSAKFERNITEKESELGLSIYDSQERPRHEASAIKADLSIWTKSSPGNGWLAHVQGVHFPSGQIIMTTTSSKFNSLPAFPHLALNADGFHATKSIMNETIHKLQKTSDDGLDGFAFAPQCELIVWLQPLPHQFDGLTPIQTREFLQQVEQELQQPEGAPIGPPPPLAFSAVIFSPDCGYILGSDSIFGPKVETYWALAQRLLFSFIMVVGLQIALLKRQMEKAATPSTRSRIAYNTIVIAALGDGLFLFALIALLMIDEAAFLMVASAAFLSCIHVAFLEVKFVFDIWTVQVDAERERQIREAAHSAPAPPAAPTTTPASEANEPDRRAPSAPSPERPAPDADESAGLPLPATAPRPEDATPIIIPSDQDTPVPARDPRRRSFAQMYSRFYFSLVMLMFFSLWAMSWPRALRSAYANFLVFCYFSFWWPQIYRNIMRNCRKALSWEYVLGSSVLRAVPVLYWYFADHNILSIDPSPPTAVIMLGWLWLQVALLASQQFLGPRLLVRDSWCPQAYDYHPILREDDVEANGMSLGLLASASEAKDKDDKTRKVFDCAICMNEIDVPVLSQTDGAGGGAAWLEQRNYMVTPCRHIFHAECLEGWMNLRLVCPVCREALPPL
ncbi:uncharacterized protein Z518_03448 [Rhinocladiella mackenziei CBS 650.93]|uniref:DSC E3 ubiquitin ligase complex subunit A n=1 Tax=Rhinocladiella mackenziei CBS 650.93 TaxID=1442369 RepID=A0A0D2IZD7_9EURO|nr:uncharacterized protein Z518_03448 [Rhinocladiella mackenziei CBS 650.93]KIX08791.1 hypothetical protein Z518_03448 [Rhinocladiella mackenziei CBS 650.93]